MKDTYGFMEDVPTLIRISNSNKDIKPIPSLATLPPPLNDIDKSSKNNNIMLVSSPSSISVKKETGLSLYLPLILSLIQI